MSRSSISRGLLAFLLSTGAVLPLLAQTVVPVSLGVDAQSNRHPISPLIYGTAFATAAQLSDLNAPLNRSGGNTQTRYNWLTNAANHAADWYFESLDSGSAAPGADADNFINTSIAGGAQPMITIPTIGWVAKLGPGRAHLASYSVTLHGAQTGTDPYWSEAGNGVGSVTGQPITGNDPNEANVSNNAAFQQQFVQHLVNLHGQSGGGGVRYYLMDNEPSIWHGTHRDVHPVGSTMQETRNNLFNYAAAVKAVDPAALVCAPEEWGWSGYFYGGYDQQWSAAHGNWNPVNFPDRATNGGADFGPWFLDQARQRAATTGQRLLDFFTLHYYPQGGEFGNDTSTAMQKLRNRSTRSLWDPAYVDQTWIGAVVKLVPRMKSWVAEWYPGTKTGVTEYNWGAEGHMNGATTQADILGIFGREGLDLATRWTTPATGSPTYLAVKMYRNYDGGRSAFGDTSVSVTAPDPDNVSAFAATRTDDGALTLMVVNKQPTNPAALAIRLTNFVATGAAQVWQLKSVGADPAAAAIAHPGSVSLAGGILSNTVPAQSVTLFVVPGATVPVIRAPAATPGPGVSFWLDGQAGQRYVVSCSSNLADWSPLWTNTLAGDSTNLSFSAPDTKRFYRAHWLP